MPPDDDEIPPEERPTQPDLFRAPCPACADANGIPTGEVVTEEWDLRGHLHRMTIRVCDWCDGKKIVDRETLARWGAATKGSDEIR